MGCIGTGKRVEAEVCEDGRREGFSFVPCQMIIPTKSRGELMLIERLL